MRRNARGTGVGRWRTRDRPWRRPRLWGVVAVVAVAVAVALQVAGCGGGGTITDPSPSSRGAASTAEGPVSASAVVEGLGAPLPVRPVGHVSLADLVVHAVGVTPSGDLWVAGAARWNRATFGLYGEWFVDPLATGVWHGTYGKPGTWYPMGSVEGLTVGPDGRVWVITGTALATFDQGAWRRVLGPGGAVLSGVSGQVGGAPSLAVGPDGWVWAVGPAFGTMVRFDGGVTVLSGPGWAADGAVCGIGTVAATAHGTAWTADASPWGYRGCLLRWDGATWTRERPLGLTELSIYRLASDTDGGLWAWLFTCEADEHAWAAGRIPDACRRAQLCALRWQRLDPPVGRSVVGTGVSRHLDGSGQWVPVVCRERPPVPVRRRRVPSGLGPTERGPARHGRPRSRSRRVRRLCRDRLGDHLRRCAPSVPRCPGCALGRGAYRTCSNTCSNMCGTVTSSSTEPYERTAVSKVDQQRAMREARWQNRATGSPLPTRRSAPASPESRPAPVATPTQAATDQLASGQSLERPPVQPGRSIGAYKQPDLVALVAWIMSDGVSRTDGQVLELVSSDLGFTRPGRVVRTRVSEAITVVLESSAAAVS